MEKIAENDEEILYVNKNNPFGVEKIKEITKTLKEKIEVDEDNFIGFNQQQNENGLIFFGVLKKIKK